jgi:predicted nucleic acid-binding protein
MILLDTNVLIYASDKGALQYGWARRTIADAVAAEGAAVNAIAVAELCVGDAEPATVADRLRSWGIEILDIPSAAAEPCARAYVAYRRRRQQDSRKDSPGLPLPDFFIGAHAQIMGWTLATADKGRYSVYFPKVQLKTP